MSERPPPRQNVLRGLSLRYQSLLFLGGALLIVLAIYLWVVSFAVMESFGRIQDELATQRSDRLVRQLEYVADAQTQAVLAAAVSDAAYRFLATPGQEIPAAPSTDWITRLPSGRKFVLFVDRRKNIGASFALQPNRTLEEALPIEFAADLLKTPALLDDMPATVLHTVPSGLYLFSAAPVLRSDGSGPSAGWLVVGQLLDAPWFDAASQLTGVEAWPISTGTYTGTSLRAATNLLRTDELGAVASFFPAAGDWAERDVVLEFERSLTGEPIRLFLNIPSVVFSTALKMRAELIVFAVVGGLCLCVASLFVVELVFLRRILRMDRDFQRISSGEEAYGRLDPSGNDELSRLACSANHLLDRIRRGRSEAEMQRGLLSGVLDAAREGIMAFRTQRSSDGKIEDFVLVLANHSAERIVGRPSADMVGRTLLTLFPASRPLGNFDRFARVVETGKTDDIEFFYDDGHLCGWFDVGVAPWSDGFVVTFEEISHRKKTEQEIREHVEEIERFNRAMVGREMRVLEMKTEVNDLCNRLGLPAAYRIDGKSDEI